MPCYTRTRRGQTPAQRIAQVKRIIARVDAMLSNGVIRAKVSPQGAIAFAGLSDELRDDVTDACIYRSIMAIGSATARLAIQRAELLAGHTVSRTAIAAGVHSHDGGATWHNGHT